MLKIDHILCCSKTAHNLIYIIRYDNNNMHLRGGVVEEGVDYVITSDSIPRGNLVNHSGEDDEDDDEDEDDEEEDEDDDDARYNYLVSSCL